MWHHITHHITTHDMTSRNQPHYFASRHLPANCITSSRLATNHMVSCHITSHHITTTDTPRKRNRPLPEHHNQSNMTGNGWRLAHTKNSVWAAHWLVTLCTLYRQILSLASMVFSPWNFCPHLAQQLLVDKIKSWCNETWIMDLQCSDVCA